MFHLLLPVLLSPWLVSQVCAVPSSLSEQHRVWQEQIDRVKIAEQKLNFKSVVASPADEQSDEYSSADEYSSFREYGKQQVKLLYVNKDDKFHQITELTVSTGLVLNNDDEYRGTSLKGVIATDTQKNIIYILAKKYGVEGPEVFALRLANFFLAEYPHVVRARVNIVQSAWSRHIDSAGRNHTHGFIGEGPERTARVIRHRNKAAEVSGGVSNFKILKTAKSSHVGFWKDKYTTLADAHDRILSTLIEATWKFTDGLNMDKGEFTKSFDDAMLAIEKIFFGPADEGRQSTLVQETQRAAQAEILRGNTFVESVFMSWPNRHYFIVDFKRFPEVSGLNEEGQGEVYLATDLPYGVIESTLHRDDL